jgi:drug/metabolite transporter (DMT)-like permease
LSTLLYCLVSMMVLCWSGNYIAAKIVFREIPSFLVMGLRTALAAVLMIPVFWYEARKRRLAWTGREVLIIIALGVFGMTLNQLFWTIGVARTTVVHSSMIMASTPVWVLLMAGLMGLERITLPKLGGMGVAMAGVALLQIFRPRITTGGPTLAGDFLVLMCALVLAAMTAFGKRYKPYSGGIAIVAVGYFGGAIALTPLALWMNRGFAFSRITPGAWAGVFYMAAFSSIAGYLIYYYALARIPASRVAAFQYLQPVFASLLAVGILGEELTGAAMAAGGVIFAGVYVTERFG